jgi:hypothetical protein
MPSRILALSNLVRDRFHFVRNSSTPRHSFYRYLGVRQGTNLTTTGAQDRSVGEAFLSMCGRPAKYRKFSQWADTFFPGSELALGFPKLSRRELTEFLNAPDRTELISRMWRRRRGPQRDDPPDSSIEESVAVVSKVFEFLHQYLEPHEVINATGRIGPGIVIRPAQMSTEAAQKLEALQPLFEQVSRVGYTIWPTLMFESQGWLPFDRLSSGEQNLISVGVKLIAYASPRSLIVIDEPEVSLNVSWQQRYLELISSSLDDAQGCHVIIATHSPYFVAGLAKGTGTIVLVRKADGNLSFETKPAQYEAWGAEAVLYEVLDIPSASSFAFNRELAEVLHHIQDNGSDKAFLNSFLSKCERLELGKLEPLAEVVDAIRQYVADLP